MNPNTLANTIATRTRTLTRTVLQLDGALRTATPTGYPTGGHGRGSGHGDPTCGAALARTTGTGPGYNPADTHAELLRELATITAALDVIDTFAAQWVKHQPGQHRCNGKIRPECVNIADPDGHGLCVNCRALACPRCWVREREGRLSPSTGESCCEACYRREFRAAS